MRKTILAIFAAGMLISCASKQQSPILIERSGIKKDERNYHVVQEGFGIDARLKKVFLAGYVAEGMNKNLVNLLWGPPDRESENGLTWEYINYKTGEVITRLRWEEIDPLQHRGVDWTNASKLVGIEGDPYGGSPPPPSFDDDGIY
ncbi:MAG: hypothetical protein LBC85_01480 [Fibromonadaceae bacterium]|jgi:hypothetical protein|nr:hypothetical protein [Fibromonadaceae bacterium]